MDKSTFEVVDPLMDEIAESTDQVLDSPELAQLRTLLTELENKLGDRYLVSLRVTVNVFDHRSCRECGATLGDNVKILLDTDVCPNCEQGRISMTNPVCSKCGYKVDLNLVVWG